MTRRTHHYAVDVQWTGNLGIGTKGYRSYARDHTISAIGKSEILGSADAAFRGDATRWNPEELLVAAISACHKLWYLHLCADAGVVVLSYEDRASGVMEEDHDGGAFKSVTLRPRVIVESHDYLALAEHLHDEAHHKCFVANSVNFPITCNPEIVSAPLGEDRCGSEPLGAALNQP